MSPAPIDVNSPEFEELLNFLFYLVDDTEFKMTFYAPDTINIHPLFPEDLEYLQKVIPRRYHDWRIYVRLEN